MDQRNKELAAVLEVSKVLTASFDLEDNLTSAMKTLGTLLEMQRGCVWLLDGATKDLRIAAAHGLTPDEIKKGKYHIGEGIVGRVIESGDPMFVPDIGEEPMFLNRTGSRPNKDGISFLSVPISFKGEVFGVIGVDRIYSSEHGGVDDDLRVLWIVASLIAQFVKLWENWRRTEAENISLRAQLKDRFSQSNIIGESVKFRNVLKTALKAAGTDATVLLLGESGTGKELFARTLHFQSKRTKGPFVAVNCAALPENLLEVELFGAEKGAFTGAMSKRIGRFELANGGTIFLDEVAEMPYSLQAKLLRVLETRTFEPLGSSKSIRVDVRVIAATNKDIHAEVAKGSFRGDLYWRLNVVPIVLPSLRDRRDDIPLLIDYYLEKFNRTYSKRLRFAEQTLDALKSYSWPGNVRELANTLERLVIMADSDTLIEEKDLPHNIIEHDDVMPGVRLMAEDDFNLPHEVQNLERARILRALKENDMVQSKAAKSLGFSQRQLGYRIKKYSIDV